MKLSNPPAGYPRISPYLNHEDTGAMMEWLSRAFGLVERHAVDPEGHRWYFACRISAGRP